MINEIDTLRTLDHPNVVKIYEYFEDMDHFYIIMDLISGGELFDEIIRKGHLSEHDSRVLLNCLLSTIQLCHSNNIIHRDLKPENILLEESHDYDKMKVIDFGLACRF